MFDERENAKRKKKNNKKKVSAEKKKKKRHPYGQECAIYIYITLPINLFPRDASRNDGTSEINGNIRLFSIIVN